jgi:hypothetical protein
LREPSTRCCKLFLGTRDRCYEYSFRPKKLMTNE